MGVVQNAIDINKLEKETLKKVDWDVTQGSISRNLLLNTASGATVSGLTYTVEADKSVKVNGTASAAVNIKVCDMYLPCGKYHISGGPADGSASTYSLEVAWQYPGGSYAYLHDYGEGVDIDATGTIHVIVNCTIRTGQEVTDLVYKPMITLADLVIEYEPYQEPIAIAMIKGAAAGASDFAAFKTAIANL